MAGHLEHQAGGVAPLMWLPIASDLRWVWILVGAEQAAVFGFHDASVRRFIVLDKTLFAVSSLRNTFLSPQYKITLLALKNY